MDIDTNNKNYIKKEILIYCLGYLNALKYKILPINQKFFDKDIDTYISEQDPMGGLKTISWIKDNNLGNDLEEILEEMLELGAILSLIPNEFDKKIDELIDRVLISLKKIPVSVFFYDKNIFIDCIVNYKCD